MDEIAAFEAFMTKFLVSHSTESLTKASTKIQGLTAPGGTPKKKKNALRRIAAVNGESKIQTLQRQRHLPSQGSDDITPTWTFLSQSHFLNQNKGSEAHRAEKNGSRNENLNFSWWAKVNIPRNDHIKLNRSILSEIYKSQSFWFKILKTFTSLTACAISLQFSVSILSMCNH